MLCVALDELVNFWQAADVYINEMRFSFFLLAIYRQGLRLQEGWLLPSALIEALI